MKTKVVIFLILFLSVNTLLIAQKPYISKEGKFTIAFAKAPEVSSTPVETAVGTIDMYMFTHEESTAAANMLAYCDYPLSMVNENEPYLTLQNAVDGFISDLQLTVEKTEKLKFGKSYSAIQVKAKSDVFFVVLKDIMVKNRLYQIAIMRSDRYPTEAEIKKFIGSFALTQ